MDYGLLFRKRTDVSRLFVKGLQQRLYSRISGEAPSDILLSYLGGLIVTKLLTTPLEVSEIVCQVLLKSEVSSLRAVLLSALFRKGRRRLWAGLGIDLLILLTSVVSENAIVDLITAANKKYKRTPSLQRFERINSLDELERVDGRWKEGLCGKLVAALATYPLTVWRTRTVVTSYLNADLTPAPFTFKLFPAVNAVVPTLFHAVSYMVLKHCIMAGMRGGRVVRAERDMDEDRAEERFTRSLIVDFSSGFLAELLCYPMVVAIRKLHTTDTKKHFVSLLKEIWQSDGLRGLFSGVQFHVINSVAIYFGVMLSFSLLRSVIAGKASESEEGPTP